MSNCIKQNKNTLLNSYFIMERQLSANMVAKELYQQRKLFKPYCQLRKRSKSNGEAMDVDSLPEESRDVAMEVELPSVVACTEGFSTNKLVQFNIEDIDSEDVDDPQVFLWNFPYSPIFQQLISSPGYVHYS